MSALFSNKMILEHISANEKEHFKAEFSTNYYRLYTKRLGEGMKDINIIEEKDIALSSIDYLDNIQVTDSSEWNDSQLSEAFDSSLD